MLQPCIPTTPKIDSAPSYPNTPIDIPISPMAQKTILLITKIIKQIPYSTPTLTIGKLPKAKTINPIDGRK